MLNVETIGSYVDIIDVKISYRIIELFSAGLYSSSNKAFEELVCNSYDAFADHVAVYIPPDLSVDGASIWVCDNGESMDQQGLKELWNIGESLKRIDPSRDHRRLQIGRFGIGKLATYVLANKLTYICKKNGRYLAVTMDYQRINKTEEKLYLEEREIQENEAEALLARYLTVNGQAMTPFDLFGEKASESWTFSILTNLKSKAQEIKEGRLKWVLKTALPLNPGFKLYYNGSALESSKITKSLKKIWTIGKDDVVADSMDSVSTKNIDESYYVDFENLKSVSGQIELYEESLVDGSKSASIGRSHGIFLIVRGRLINVDDPLLGMEAFSHGAFNKTRIMIYADELDANLTSTRESIKESNPLFQLKDYIKKKFNNEIRKYYFEEENKKEEQRKISYRLSQTSLTVSKRPLYTFAEKFFNQEIVNPLLIIKPTLENKDILLQELRNDLTGDESIIKDVHWNILDGSDPIARMNLETGCLTINLLHPYIANYNDAYKSYLPLQFLAITEVLTEAHLYEIGIDELLVNSIMRRRDNTLRELSLSDREGTTAVAQMLKDSLADSTGMEDSVHRAFLSLGFESTKIGGNGKPDGKASAILGYSSEQKNENYSLIFDSKSTLNNKIKANTTNLATINSHKLNYSADFAIVVAKNFEGADDPQSLISTLTCQQKITAIKAVDLIRLLLLSAPKQIGLKKIRNLFETCYSPMEVADWINKVEQEVVEIGPFKLLLDTIYELQSNDTEPPEIAGIRQKLNNDLPNNEKISKEKIKAMLESLRVFVPGFISIEGERVGIQGNPDQIMKIVSTHISAIPSDFRKLYLDAFSSRE